MNEIDANIATEVEKYLEENPVDIDMTGYATEKYVEDAISVIELTPGPAGPQGEPGKDGKDGAPGKDGQNGQDGKTPVRGTDYWTSEDKAEIVADVLAAMPAAEGVSV